MSNIQAGPETELIKKKDPFLPEAEVFDFRQLDHKEHSLQSCLLPPLPLVAKEAIILDT